MLSILTAVSLTEGLGERIAPLGIPLPATDPLPLHLPYFLLGTLLLLGIHPRSIHPRSIYPLDTPLEPLAVFLPDLIGQAVTSARNRTAVPGTIRIKKGKLPGTRLITG